ncbi:putative transmembrane protein [Collimonas arenae]|uniref:Putative transmembrane protein n=1 Tax=Collimonas arenae TaxID=279058 RepID=A0A0A1F8M2_9BURK|nr:DUF3999 domain-containing protein [Collimonas arenae]AIY39217.1 putative transmembrane protein [Collimonas arenae]
MKHFPGLNWLRAAAVACVLAAPLAAWPASDSNTPQSYALQLPVQFNSGAPLQRLVLPAQVLVSLQTGGMSDLRIFNGQGQPLSMAMSDSASLRQTENQKIVVQSSPIIGTPDVKDLSASSLRIEDQQGKRVVQIDGGASGGAQSKTVLGALLDTRAITDAVVGMVLDVDLPDAQPITFTLQMSKDLKDWRPLAETVLYRAEATADHLGAGHIALQFAEMKDHYVRVTWTDSAGHTAPVLMRSATLTTARGVSNLPRVSAALARPVLINPYELRFSLPFATPVAALDIKPAGDNVLIPVRVLGRNDPGQPWAVLAASVIYHLQTAGKVQDSAAIELPPTAFRQIKIEADKKTPGFSALPAIALEFEPAQIVALVNGQPPFTLAAGLANAASPYLPMQSLMPGYQAAQENSLPLATIDSSPAAVQATASRDGMPTRTLILWGVLLVAALALGAMAWVLLKQNNKAAAEDQ